MSNRRKLRPGGLPRIERCDRCRRPAAHVLVVPPADGNNGYEVLACRGCWPALRVAAEQLGVTIGACSCGRC